MAYTDIADKSVVNLSMAKNYLRIDSDDTILDPILKLAIRAAKEAADNYCQNSFTEVPAEIEMWILGVILLWWERKGPLLKSAEQKDLGITEWKFDYDDYFHAIKCYRREVGFGWS